MAFVTLNGFDVEHASSLLVYENLFPEIQHINGKGCNDTYTKTNDVESVTYVDVMRVLPYAPRFRQLGATNNGSWHNQKNEGGFNNAPQSVHYTIPVDLIYDEGVAITSPQTYSNPIQLKAVVMAQLIKTAGLSINIITFAKQFEAFFADSFSATPTADEIAAAVFAADSTKAADAEGSYADAFIAANSALTDGCVEIGALQIPLDERQAFVTPQFDRIMKRQYMQNASEAAARILANGFINPFNGQESTRINSATGLCGQYDGVDLFLYNSVTNKFVEVALGIDSSVTANATNVALFRKMRAMIVYGAGTCRGIVGPSVSANPNVYFGGVYILPKLKVGVEVLNGKTIKLVVDGGWTAEDITALKSALKFTPIDGSVVTGSGVFGSGVFNDGTKN
jgi:hypothetical protein